MKLRQAEPFGMFDHHDRCVRHINPDLDDGRGHQDPELAIIHGLDHGRERRGTGRRLQPAPPRVLSTSAFEASQDSDFYTIIEVSGEDRLGILYEITKGLTDHGCDIHFARISTLGNRIVDVFYAQDDLGEKIEGKEKEEHLKQTLLNHLAPRSASDLA